MVPNHENKGDYYMNSCLSQSMDALWFQKMVGSEAFLTKTKHQFIYPKVENEFVALNHLKKGDYYVNPCLPQLKNEL